MPASSSSTAQPEQAELLEKIKRAELEASSRIEEAKREAEKIRADARGEADRIVKEAQGEAEKLRADILQTGKSGMQKELDAIQMETARGTKQTEQQKDKKVDLKGIVLSVLGL